MYISIHIYIYIYILCINIKDVQEQERNARESANSEQTDFLRTGTASAANQTAPDRTGCGLERNALVLSRKAADLDRSGPDWTRLDRTGLDQTSLRLGEEWTNSIQKGK